MVDLLIPSLINLWLYYIMDTDTLSYQVKIYQHGDKLPSQSIGVHKNSTLTLIIPLN